MEINTLATLIKMEKNRVKVYCIAKMVINILEIGEPTTLMERECMLLTQDSCLKEHLKWGKSKAKDKCTWKMGICTEDSIKMI